MEFDQEFVEYVAKAIVNHPEDVWTERIVDDYQGVSGVLITLHVNQEDMGHVIGGAGKTAVAIRTLLRPIAAKANMRIGFRIHDPSGRTFGEKKEGFVNHATTPPTPVVARVMSTPAASAPAPITAPTPRVVHHDDMDTTTVGDLTF